jgi:hypothetical protein
MEVHSTAAYEGFKVGSAAGFSQCVGNFRRKAALTACPFEQGLHKLCVPEGFARRATDGFGAPALVASQKTLPERSPANPDRCQIG